MSLFHSDYTFDVPNLIYANAMIYTIEYFIYDDFRDKRNKYDICW